MDYFSSALRYEYSDKGIIVQVGSCDLIWWHHNHFFHYRVLCHFLLPQNCQESNNLLLQFLLLKSLLVMPWLQLGYRTERLVPYHMSYKWVTTVYGVGVDLVFGKGRKTSQQLWFSSINSFIVKLYFCDCFIWVIVRVSYYYSKGWGMYFLSCGDSGYTVVSFYTVFKTSCVKLG